jgi:transposase
MKTQLSKPVREKRKFTKEYKEEALEHWKSSGRSAATVAEELGIRAPLLYRWARQRRVATQQGGHSPLETRASVKVDAKDLEAEIRRLREENAKLLEQREVLKKSLGIPCEAPHRGMPGSNA